MDLVRKEIQLHHSHLLASPCDSKDSEQIDDDDNDDPDPITPTNLNLFIKTKCHITSLVLFVSCHDIEIAHSRSLGHWQKIEIKLPFYNCFSPSQLITLLEKQRAKEWEQKWEENKSKWTKSTAVITAYSKQYLDLKDLHHAQETQKTLERFNSLSISFRNCSCGQEIDFNLCLEWDVPLVFCTKCAAPQILKRIHTGKCIRHKIWRLDCETCDREQDMVLMLVDSLLPLSNQERSIIQSYLFPVTFIVSTSSLPFSSDDAKSKEEEFKSGLQSTLDSNFRITLDSVVAEDDLAIYHKLNEINLHQLGLQSLAWWDNPYFTVCKGGHLVKRSHLVTTSNPECLVCKSSELERLIYIVAQDLGLEPFHLCSAGYGGMEIDIYLARTKQYVEIQGAQHGSSWENVGNDLHHKTRGNRATTRQQQRDQIKRRALGDRLIEIWHHDPNPVRTFCHHVGIVTNAEAGRVAQYQNLEYDWANGGTKKQRV